MMPTPTVGRIVHYQSHGTPIRPDGSQAFTGQCRAAVVTEVDPADPARVGLMVCNPTGQFFHSLADGGCEYDGTVTEVGGAPTGGQRVGGSWHWPCTAGASTKPPADTLLQDADLDERWAKWTEQGSTG